MNFLFETLPHHIVRLAQDENLEVIMVETNSLSRHLDRIDGFNLRTEFAKKIGNVPRPHR